MDGVAQQPYSSFWYQNSAYNPFSVSGADFGNANLYFPYSVAHSDYPGFPILQSALPTTLEHRPIFLMCYNQAHFSTTVAIEKNQGGKKV